MNCSYHAERDSVGTCLSCGRAVCAECKVLLADTCFCNPCADAAYSRASASAQRRPNWFERHLNVTALLSWVVAYVVAFITGFVVGVAMYGSDPDRVETVAMILAFALTLAWLLVANGWVLRKKGQSEWHLVWLLVPFGMFVILLLQNKNDVPGMTGPPTV